MGFVIGSLVFKSNNTFINFFMFSVSKWIIDQFKSVCHHISLQINFFFFSGKKYLHKHCGCN